MPTISLILYFFFPPFIAFEIIVENFAFFPFFAKTLKTKFRTFSLLTSA